MRIKWYYFLKKFFVPQLSNFLAKNQKTIFAKKMKNFRLRKFDSIWTKSIFWEKKCFHPFKRHRQQNWRAERMPVVARRLVYFKITRNYYFWLRKIFERKSFNSIIRVFQSFPGTAHHAYCRTVSALKKHMLGCNRGYEAQGGGLESGCRPIS